MSTARVRRSWRAAALAGAILLWAAGLVGAALPQARCLRVLDGDSVVLRLDGREIEARLDGIDAPERGQPFGDRARRELARLAAGRLVEVDTRGTDRYGRLLVRLHAGGIEVNRERVRRGLAWHYERYSDDPALAAAEQAARTERLGLWRDPDPIPPWTWRARTRPLTPTTEPPAPAAAGALLHGNTRSFVYHLPGCPHYDCRHCTRAFTTRAAAEAAGYRPAGCCAGRQERPPGRRPPR